MKFSTVLYVMGMSAYVYHSPSTTCTFKTNKHSALWLLLLRRRRSRNSPLSLATSLCPASPAILRPASRRRPSPPFYPPDLSYLLARLEFAHLTVALHSPAYRPQRTYSYNLLQFRLEPAFADSSELKRTRLVLDANHWMLLTLK